MADTVYFQDHARVGRQQQQKIHPLPQQYLKAALPSRQRVVVQTSGSHAGISGTAERSQWWYSTNSSRYGGRTGGQATEETLIQGFLGGADTGFPSRPSRQRCCTIRRTMPVVCATAIPPD